MYPIPELAKLMRASLPACSSSEMPCKSTCTLSNTLARSLLYYFRHRLKSSVCWAKGLSAGETDAHHGSVQEGVDVEHGLQLQSVIQTVVLVTIPETKNLVINQATNFPKIPVQNVSSSVTCTCFPESGRCLDSGTAFQEGSSSWQDGPGTACL